MIPGVSAIPGSAPLQLGHDAANQIFGVCYGFGDQLNVHGRLAQLTYALAVNAMLANENERVCEDIERDCEAASGDAHHELVFFEFIAPLIVYAHVFYSSYMSIPGWPISGQRERELIDQVFESDRWGGFHPFIPKFEADFAAFQQCRFGVAAMNGTVTLEALLEALDIRQGEVIVPAISFISTATAVSRLGATPVFVDIDDTFNLNPERVRAAITPETRAMIVVHFGGPMADMDALMQIAGEENVLLIEDAAHAHGSEWKGRRAGSLGCAGSFSFQNGKVMTAGEGGILVSNDENLMDTAREIVNQGRRKGEGWFAHYSLGTNYRMTAFQAAVLIAQLERLPEQNCRRARNASIIREELTDCPELHFQRVAPEARTHTNYLLTGWIEGHRDRFHRNLTAAGFPCTPFYPHTLQNNPLYRNGTAPCRVTGCPVAEARIRDGFWIPHRALLGDENDARLLAQAMREALR
jgi:dTDP-4-amino-4,6-dideoxygalactose transaminase